MKGSPIMRCHRKIGPMKKMDERQNHVLYDGDCGVCTRLMDHARAMDQKQIFAFAAYQSVDESEMARYGITPEACHRQLQIITSAGKIHSGAFAVNYFLWHQMPWKICVLIIYLLPPLLVIEMIGYRLFARYRSHISQWLGLTTCTLPPIPPR